METGASVRIVLTATSEMNVLRFNDVSSLHITQSDITNFYNVGGLCVDSFNYKLSGDSYEVTMDIYNVKNMYGSVCAYDEHGILVDSSPIERFNNYVTGLWDVAKSAWYLPGQVYELFADPYAYKNANVTAHTEISISVPKNGYITITNDVTSSPVAYLYNVVNFAVSASFTSAGITASGLDVKTTDKVVEKTVEKILKELPKSILENVLEDVTKKPVQI